LHILLSPDSSTVSSSGQGLVLPLSWYSSIWHLAGAFSWMKTVNKTVWKSKNFFWGQYRDLNSGLDAYTLPLDPCLLFFVVVLGGTGVWNWGFALTKHVLCALSLTS
jgi:hypothetical protein